MKLYKHEPKSLIRVALTKKEHESIYLTFSETTPEQCLKNIEDLLSKIKVSPIQEKFMTRIDIRHAIGGSNGKSMSISLKGITPKEIEGLFIKNFS
jgi:hypothetical protein